MARRDPKPDPTSMPQEDNVPGGPAAPQGLAFSMVICKHIHNYVWYLYSTPGTSYLQLMVAMQKGREQE